MNCPIRGHQHELKVVRNIVQKGTGNKAALWECPGGNYRWLVLDGQQPSPLLRFSKPRYGWKKEA